MTRQELETRLSQAMDHTAPNDFDDVLLRSETRKQSGNFAEKGVIMMSTPKKKRNYAIPCGLIAACLVLALAGGGFSYYQYQAGTVASVISLDVNPSIELTINKNNKVLSCTPLNADAAAVLFDMNSGADLEGTKVDVAVNAIVGALVRHGYLDSVSSAILISVEDADQERAAQLQAQLSNLTQSILQAQESGADVISQTLTMDAGLDQQARQNNISSGKAALINQIIALNGSLAFDQLAALSVEELQELLRAGAPGMPIGKAAALYAAEQYAGTLMLDSVTGEVDAELDETPAHYEVELQTLFGEFEYLVDAYTGEILYGWADLLTWIQNVPPAPEQSSPSVQEPASAQTTPPVSGAASESTTLPTPEQNSETPVPPIPSTPQPGIPNSGGNEYIGQEAAKIAALSHAGLTESDVLYCNCWIDYDDGYPECYKVEFTAGNTEYEYEIGLYNAAILKHETEHHGSSHHSSHHGTSSSGTGTTTTTDIGTEAAKAAALAHAGLSESQVTRLKVERDYDDGWLEYEVEFQYGRTEYEYTIDGTTGAILEYEQDDD